MTNGKSPEQWAAKDHIDTLKKRMESNKERLEANPDGVCSEHIAMVNGQNERIAAQVWQINQMDVLLKNGGNGHDRAAIEDATGLLIQFKKGPVKLVAKGFKAVGELIVFVAVIWILLRNYGVNPIEIVNKLTR